MRLLLFCVSCIFIASCTFSDSPKYDKETKSTDKPVQHTGTAAAQDTVDSLPHHETGYNPDMDSNEAKGTMGGTPSGKGTTKTDIARHGIGNSTPGFKTTSIDTVKKKKD